MTVADYTIESIIPFTVKVKNQAGRALLLVWILLFFSWAYFQIKFINSFVSFFIVLLTNEPRGEGTVIYNPPYLEQIFSAMIWVLMGGIFIVVVVLGFLFGVVALQEILWRLSGTETFEISKEQITWSRQIPFVRLVKSFPVDTLSKICVLRPENVDIAKLDKLRPKLVFFRAMGSGAISLEYGNKAIGVFSLIGSTEAEKILLRLQELSYFDLPIEVQSSKTAA